MLTYFCKGKTRAATNAYCKGVRKASIEYFLYDNPYNHDIKYPTLADLFQKMLYCKKKRIIADEQNLFYEQGYFKRWTDLLRRGIIKRAEENVEMARNPAYLPAATVICETGKKTPPALQARIKLFYENLQKQRR